jgi:hypothetical protein
MAVRDFFQNEDEDEEDEEVELAAGGGRSLREEEEAEGLSRGFWRAFSVGDGEGSGRERRRAGPEWSRESALWSVTMSRASAESLASPPRWSPPPRGGRDDMAGDGGGGSWVSDATVW